MYNIKQMDSAVISLLFKQFYTLKHKIANKLRKQRRKFQINNYKKKYK